MPLTPIAIDPTRVVDDIFAGPVSANGALYVSGLIPVFVAGGPVEYVYKSTDGGLTWTAQDTVHAPPNMVAWCLSPSGDRFVLCCTNVNTGVIFLQDYVFSTDTFSAAYALVGAPGGFPNVSGVCRLSNGDTRLIYAKGTPVTLYQARFSSGSWVLVDNPVTGSTVSGADVGIGDVITDAAANVVHIDWFNGDLVVSPIPAYYRSINADDSLNTIHTFPSVFENAGDPFTGGGLGASNSIVLPYKTSPSAGVAVWRGTPRSNPVWNSEVVDSDIADQMDFSSVYTSGGTDHLIWVDSNHPPINDFDAYLFQSTNSGFGWTAKTLTYDCIANPPSTPPPASTQNMAGGDPGFSTAGILVSMLEAVPTHGDRRTMFFFPGTISLSCPSSSASVGVAYSSSFTVTGGTAPYTFAIIAGALPPGLTLNASTGAVTGTPTTPGTYNYTGQVTDTNGLMATASCTITVLSALAASCPTPNTIAIGVAYSGTITVTGGTPPYTFALTGGSLPPGLSLNGSTGVISGTPTQAGMFSYQITVTDSLGATTVISCQFTIGNPTPGTNCPPAFELHRLVLTLREERHMPVRGSLK